MVHDEERIVRPEGERVTVAEEQTTRPATGIRFEPTDDVRVAVPETYNWTRDRVRWGPIVAGYLTALTTLLLLSVLGLAVGLTTVNPNAVANQGALPPETATFSAIWGAVAGLVAFLIGGYVAGRAAAVFNRGWGAFNGAMVFLLGVPLTLWLAGMGLGGILGLFSGGVITTPAPATANQVQAGDVAMATMGAWWTLIGMVLALGASALGGFLGTRRSVDAGARYEQRV